MSKRVEECVSSVLDDNPEYSEERAYAICQAMQNRGELSVSDDPSHDELLTAAAQQDIDCPEGHVHTGSKCVPIEDVRDVPPTLLSAVYTLSEVETEPIERIEESGNTVRYKNVKLLSPGVWTDSESRETIWYSPKGMEGLEISEDNAVNIMHDAENEVSEAGEIDSESVHSSEDGVYADLVLDTSNAAGQYADENLQKTLETQGAKGFGGPSVEIDAEGQDVEFNERKGMKELVGGIISGLGLVKNPASKPVSFARQTANRGVALSDAQNTMYLEEAYSDMDPEEAREILEKFGFDTGDMDDEDVVDMLKDMGEEIMDYMERGETEEPGGEDDGEDVENADDEEDPDDDGDDETDVEEESEGMDMEDRIESLEERLTNVEDMVESAMAAEDVQEELAEFGQDLADADTAQELSEAVEELEKRLSDVEERPTNPKSLADGDGDSETEDTRNITPAPVHDSVRGTTSR